MRHDRFTCEWVRNGDIVGPEPPDCPRCLNGETAHAGCLCCHGEGRFCPAPDRCGGCETCEEEVGR